ncbi:MIF4G domain-containing protein [Actinidia rufa]|uniref:MIF4G domain-containing protein n=1 Tax=Actinidia rufa TaxID=165716 RepID=A0A7J0ER50_9ERIC|nr:MIF4G domain-containing protein [Actinidia rufa]
MQADQTVLSLRPGGGGPNGGNRVLGPAFGFSLSFDLLVLRPHGGAPPLSSKTGDFRFEGRERVRYSRDQLLQLREAGNVPDAILNIKQEVEAEFFGEDQNWGHAESNPPSNSTQQRSSLLAPLSHSSQPPSNSNAATLLAPLSHASQLWMRRTIKKFVGEELRAKSNLSSWASSRPREKGPIDSYFTPDPEEVVQSKKGKQKSIVDALRNDAHKKELRDRTCRHIAAWMYDAGIPFNAVKYDSFKVMTEAIGQYGPGMKAPTRALGVLEKMYPSRLSLGSTSRGRSRERAIDIEEEETNSEETEEADVEGYKSNDEDCDKDLLGF